MEQHNKGLTCISLKKPDQYIEMNESVLDAVIRNDIFKTIDNGALIKIQPDRSPILKLSITQNEDYITEYTDYIKRYDNSKYYFLTTEENSNESLYFVALENNSHQDNICYAYTCNDFDNSEIDNSDSSDMENDGDSRNDSDSDYEDNIKIKEPMECKKIDPVLLKEITSENYTMYASQISKEHIDTNPKLLSKL